VTIYVDLFACHSVGSSNLVLQHLAKHSATDPATIDADLSACHSVGSFNLVL
jgi:hypothetical protein